MKKLLLTAAITFCAQTAFTQTTNYALSLNGKGSVQTQTVAELNQSSHFTFQSFIFINEWNANSVIFSQLSNNNGISLSLGENQQQGLVLSMINNGKEWKTNLPGVQAHIWQQLSLIYDANSTNKIQFYINGTLQSLNSDLTALPLQTPSTSAPLKIGEGLNGKMDDMRIWGDALSEKELQWNNTITKFHPRYNSLSAYWKFDQEQCEHIVDYKGTHHGVMSGAIREAVTDNAGLRYRIVSGYTSFPRMIDRANIDSDMYKMTNDLIILSAKVLPDGRIFMDYPDNQGKLTKAGHLTEFKGRKGIINFQGEGASMDAGTETFMENPNTATTAATFEGWFHIDAWREGSYLIKKKSDDGKEISVRLGAEAGKELIATINGYEFISRNKVKTGEWQHIAIKLNAGSSRFNRKVRFQFDAGAELYADTAPSSGDLSSLPLINESTTLLGENLAGKMDEVMIWRADRTEGNTVKDANSGYKYPSGEWSDILLCSYWKGDESSNPGLDSQSWTEMDKYIRAMYKGHRGINIRYGLISAEGEKWKEMIANPTTLNRFVSEVQKLLPYTDGIDVDFEWCYTAAEWNNYGNMVERLRSVVPANKVFTCSLHAVAYKLAKKYIDMVDYFTFQIYGPSPDIWPYSRYVQAYNDFIGQGYPKDKILLSIGTLATNAQKTVVGYKNIIEANPGIGKDADQALYNGSTYTFNGVNTILQKMSFIREKDVAGSMFFDMGNDMNVSDEYSLIRAMNDEIGANVDTLINKVDIETSIHPVEGKEVNLNIYPNPSSGIVNISLPDNNDAKCHIYSLAGALVHKVNLKPDTERLDLSSLAKGIYLLTIVQNGKNYYNKLHIK